MPSWKKVITSGSNAEFNTITASGVNLTSVGEDNLNIFLTLDENNNIKARTGSFSAYNTSSLVSISASAINFITRSASNPNIGEADNSNPISSFYISESGGEILIDTQFNGNRSISNQLFPAFADGGIYGWNPFSASVENGNYATHSIAEFLEAVFYPNSPPALVSPSDKKFMIDEYSGVETLAVQFTGFNPSSVKDYIEFFDPEDADDIELLFETQSSYSYGFFEITSSGHLSENSLGIIRALQIPSRSWNESINGGSSTLFAGGAHVLPIQVTDSIGGVTRLDVHIKVNENSNPLYRTSLNSGNLTSNYEESVSESFHPDDNPLDTTLYVRDLNQLVNNFILIETGSGIQAFSGSEVVYVPNQNDDISITINSNTFTTGSGTTGGTTRTLRFQQTIPTFSVELSASSYRTVITASDAYISENNSSYVYLPVTFSVIDNSHPDVPHQQSSDTDFNENNNASGFDNFYDVSTTDADAGGIVSFQSFNLVKGIGRDGSDIPKSEIEDFLPPKNAPFQMDVTGRITKNNDNDLARISSASKYVYEVTVKDQFQPDYITGSGYVTLSVQQDEQPTSITTNASNFNSFYIRESATTNDYVSVNTSGRTGLTSHRVKLLSTTDNTDDTIVYTVSSSDHFNTDNTGLTSEQTFLRINTNLSGTYEGGDTITGEATGSTQFDFDSGEFLNSVSQSFTLNIVDNPPPTVTFTEVNSGEYLNTNEARPTGENLIRLDFTTGSVDNVADDLVDLDTVEFRSASEFPPELFNTTSFSDISGGKRTFIKALSNIPAGTYSLTSSVANTSQTRTGSNQIEFTIAQSPSPIPTSVDGESFFVLEDAQTGEDIVSQSGAITGRGRIFSLLTSFDGNPLPINYSIGGDEAAYVTSTTVNNTMSLFLKDHVSGVFYAGDELRFSVTATDAYGNTDIQPFTASVVAKTLPSFTINSLATTAFNTNLARLNDTSYNPGIDSELYNITINKGTRDVDYSTFNLDRKKGTSATTQFQHTIQGTGGGDRTLIISSSEVNGMTATQNTSGGSLGSIYNWTASIADDRGYTASVLERDFNITESLDPILDTVQRGTTNTKTTLYITEVAESSTNKADFYTHTTNGLEGNISSRQVQFRSQVPNPEFGNQEVASSDFTENSTYVQLTGGGGAINKSQTLKVDTAISGAFRSQAITAYNNGGTANPQTIFTLGYDGTDQYDNEGTDTIQVKIAPFDRPTFVINDITTNQTSSLSITGADLVAITASDGTNNVLTMDQLTFLDGGDSASFEIVNGSFDNINNGRSFTIRALENLDPGDYAFTCSIHYDGFDYISSSVSHSFNITNDYDVLVYGLDIAGGTAGAITMNTDRFVYNSYMYNQIETGDPSLSSDDYTGSVFGRFASGALGTSTFTAKGLDGIGSSTGTVTAIRLASGSLLSGSTFSQSLDLIQNPLLSPYSDLSNSRYTIIVLYPSKSVDDISNVPKEFVTSYNDTDVALGKYVPVFNVPDDAVEPFQIRDANVHESNAPSDLITSGSYTAFYGELTDLYTTWSYIHLTQDQGFSTTLDLKINLLLDNPA